MLFSTTCSSALRKNRLLLPQRLASITSVELRWDVLLFGRLPPLGGDRKAQVIDEDRAQLVWYLKYLANAFPKVRTLVSVFSDYLYNDFHVRPAQASNEIDRVLLRPLADARARLQPQAQQ